jgi:hypothetical protein
MVQLFSRTRARPSNPDAGCARSRAALIARSIEWSLRAAQAERADLEQRLKELTRRALVSLGNGTDEYLTRDSLDNRRLDRLEQEMLEAEHGLQRLAEDIAHFEFLKTSLKTRFHDFRP